MTRTGLVLLSVGLTSIAMGAALPPLAMRGTVGNICLGMGLVLSITGLLLRFRDSRSTSVASTAVACLGLALLTVATLLTTRLGHLVGIQRAHPGAIIELVPTSRDWLQAAAVALIADLSLAFGIRRMAGVPLPVLFGWASAALAVPALGFALSWTLAFLFPIH